MTNPRALAEEAKVILEARDRDRTHYEDCWRGHPDCLASHLADALIEALDDLEEQRGNAEGFWEDRERFRQENERLREALKRVLAGEPGADAVLQTVRQALTETLERERERA